MIQRIHSSLIILITIILHSLTAKAAPDTLTDSRTTITQGIALNDEGKYKEAIALFKTVPEGDTNYTWALHELGISCLEDSAWEDARNYALKALSLPERPEPRSNMLLLANADDYLGRHEEAYRTYDSLLAINPYDHQPWYEKGASYLLRGDSVRALECFRHAIMLNPGHFRSHLNLGIALLRMGRLSEAYLAISYSLLMTNEPRLASIALQRLNAIQNGEDIAINAYNNRRPGTTDPAFDEADAIVSAKLALSSDYKYESILSGDRTANTLHAILEKVSYDPRDTGVAMQYYVPFYKAAYDGGKFDALLLLMYSGFGMDAIDKLAKKHEREVKDMHNELLAYDSRIVATQEFNFTKRKNAPERFGYLPESATFVVGAVKGTDPLLFAQGPVAYYKSGVYGGKGSANAAGEKEGEWNFYYDNGSLRSTEHYHNGKLSGDANYYNRVGTIHRSFKYNAEGEPKELREYSYNGTLDAVTAERDGYADYISYHRNGAIEYKAKLKKGKIQDPVLKVMRDDGTLLREVHYSDGERDGLLREFWPSGKVYEEYNYSRGKRDGEGKTYYENGQLHVKANYSKGLLDGPYEEFDKDGKLVERGEYSNGKKTGTLEYLTPSGRVYGTVNYRRDLPVAYRFTDEQGKELSVGDKKSEEGLTLLTAYYPDGTKMTELPLSNGQAQGEARYYYTTGSISKRTRYENDKIAGKETEYYRNGAIKSETVYRDGEVDGAYTSYNDAGHKAAEGFISGGQREGLWHFYYPDGKMREEVFYVSGLENGPEKNYFGNGRLRYIRYMDRNMLVGLIEYDTAGRERSRTFYPKGEGTYSLSYPNGDLYYTCPLKAGDFDGTYAFYYPGGKLLEKGTMQRDREHGHVAVWHPNGKLATTGKVEKGSRDSTWVWYDASGVIAHDIAYKAGDQEGPEHSYAGGVLHTEYMYKDGLREGRETMYGDSGKVAVILLYHNDVLTGYTYLGKDGTELPVKPFQHGTGHVEAYYPNGQKSADYTYVGNIPTGDGARWFSNGKQQAESHYDKTGNLQNAFRRWAANGQLVYESQYKDDVIIGTEKKWNTAGQLIESFSYADNGERHGASIFATPATGEKVSLQYYYGTMTSMGK